MLLKNYSASCSARLGRAWPRRSAALLRREPCVTRNVCRIRCACGRRLAQNAARIPRTNAMQTQLPPRPFRPDRRGFGRASGVAEERSRIDGLQGRGRRRHRQCRARNAGRSSHERGFPADEVVALASRRSLGTEVSFGDRTLKVKVARQLRFLRHRHLPDVGRRRGLQGMVAEDRRPRAASSSITPRPGATTPTCR